MLKVEQHQQQMEGQFCRLCFGRASVLCPLFPPASIPNKILLHKIFDCTTITLSFRDDYNAQICSTCVVSIEAFFKYKIKCVENDKLLRKRRTSLFSGLCLPADVSNGNDGSKSVNPLEPVTPNLELDDEFCKVKQELLEDDENEFFSPDQFLAQETQIEDRKIDQPSLNEPEQNSNLESINVGFERGWKTTEYSPHPGISGPKPLKITDYSNLGKRGRPQKFITTVPTERLLARPGTQYSNSFHTSTPISVQQSRGFESAYRQHLNFSNGSETKLPVVPTLAPYRRFDPYSVTNIEQTRKVQKFLDDGLRDLIINQGAPNPNFPVDGGYTNFTVVKARCNSYNLIFEGNRFLRRNKSCSGLSKWYWACSMHLCPVKICSYKGRLFKTNDKINHPHPPTVTSEKILDVVRPDQADELLMLEQTPTTSATLQCVSSTPLQSQSQQQLQIQQEPLATALDENSSSNMEEEIYEDVDTYETVKGEEEKDAILIYKQHKHVLQEVMENGVRIWKCCHTEENGEICRDTINQLADGRIKLKRGIKKEAPTDDEANEAHVDERKNCLSKVAIYEGYHYRHSHVSPEGTLYWRCIMEHESSCLASLHTKASFEFKEFGEQSHNHEPPDTCLQPENTEVCVITTPQKPLTAPVAGITDFQLVKSGQKREFLIYQGYRYYFQYESKNGKRSYRCTMFRNCPAGAFLMPDNTIAEAKNFVHTHPPTENLEKYVTKDSLITSPIKDADGQPRRQQQTVAESGHFPMLSNSVVSASSNEEVARANGYKIIRNYKNKEILIYNGWRYFVDYKKKNGGQVWRCSSHRLCRGAVHLFPDGSINFVKLVDHNHMPPKRNYSISNMSVDSGASDITMRNPSFISGMLYEPSSISYTPPCHRYITHNGHRFRFATRKREGTIYWRCAMRLETKCPVSFHTKEDTYELVSMRNHEHNHEIPTIWPEVAGGQIDEDLPIVKMPQEEIGTTDYILTKNSKGRDVILYQNGRYYLDYSRKDGRIVFRCSFVAGCRAMIFLLPNKTLQVSKDLMHNHPAPTMMENLITQSQHPLLTLSVTKSDDEVQLVAPPDPLGMDPTPSSSTSMQLPKFIVHLGYHYKFVTKNADGQTATWRCSNFEAKMNCQAAIFTSLSGQVLRSNNIMHNHKSEDYNNASLNNSLARRKNLIGSRDYKIVKNWKNRDVLVFQQCRYFLHYVRKDGRKVWRCSAIRSCHAAVYLGADGRVDQVKGEHVHDIRAEGEPRRRRPRKPRLEVLMPGGISMSSENGSMHHSGNGSEWIDYSDYGMQMNSSSNDNNSSLWDNFNPHQISSRAVGGGSGANGNNFDFSYHSVFGNQTSFEDSFGILPDHGADTTGLDDDDEGLPLEPDVSFAENDNFDQHLEPVVQLSADN